MYQQDIPYPFKALNKVLTGAGSDEFFACVVQEAKAEIGYTSDNISFEFITDGSCLYQEDNSNAVTGTVRGIIVMLCHIKPTSLTGDEMAMVVRNGFTQIDQGIATYVQLMFT